VVVEDADRLTESAANALLKIIEEPGARTVWLLCAPTLTDVLPTIRSRCRHLTLRTPSVAAVTKLLIERDGVDPELAEFASDAAQGHIGRARYLATNEEARETRKKILNIPSTVLDLASALEAANTLLEMAKEQVKKESDTRDEEEITKLKEFYGTSGGKLASGGNRAVKDLEKKQSSRNKNELKSSIDFALQEIIFNQINLLKINLQKDGILSNNQTFKEKQIQLDELCNHLNSIFSHSKKINTNVSLQILTESLFCNLVI
jgi:DNA polymerase-3 subunit delta'